MKRNVALSDPGEVRRKLRLNQQDFWSRVGVTQSGGSRYESGRRMPKPVQELVRLVHVEGIDLAKANGTDLQVAAYLKRMKPALYRQLRKAASGSSAR